MTIYRKFSDIQANAKLAQLDKHQTGMAEVLYPDSGISMDEEIVLGDMIWSYNKAEL